jgi:hypothetical protein
VLAAALDLVGFFVALGAFVTAAGAVYSIRAKRETDKAAAGVDLIRVAQEIQAAQIQHQSEQIETLERKVTTLTDHLATCEGERTQLAQQVRILRGEGHGQGRSGA